ncbi:MAG: 16S rRNA methyltransferase [Verrucomicrobia bacterium RIFCSPLOWO2_12_FULL_64_8]|nr:MAG: 16S rRNA methyltransferase [Verrucomicrobia bacterium RIFCSPLOWO2_12_FULL_64_8]
MNLILFESDETDRPLPRTDPRARHLLEILRRGPGDTFDAGLINGPRGKGTLAAIGANELRLSFQWGEAPALPSSITLIVGLPRPQTARDILRDATALGVAAMHFVLTEKGERSYADSTLWTSGEWRHQLIAGAGQAFDTRLPEITHGRTLKEALVSQPAGAVRLALDHYEATQALSRCHSLNDISPALPPLIVLAFGPERGWSATEREQLRKQGFSLVHLGSRVLRAETAVIAAVTLVRVRLGLT